jgi:quercetin dioxygenase-like cupin family protein
MKNKSIYFFGVLLMMLSFGLYIYAAVAAEKMPEDPNVKVLLENNDVRVCEAVRPPGTIVPMHTHPAYVAYFFDAWKGKITNAKGDVKEKEFGPGDVLYSPGVTHSLEVIGTTDQHVLVIEWKKK